MKFKKRLYWSETPPSKELLEIREANAKKWDIDGDYNETIKIPDFRLDYDITKEYYTIVEKYIEGEVREFEDYPTDDIELYMRTKYNSFEFLNLFNFCHGEWGGKCSHSRKDIIGWIEEIVGWMRDDQAFIYPIIKRKYPNMGNEEAQERLLILRDKLKEISDYEVELYTEKNMRIIRNPNLK